MKLIAKLDPAAIYRFFNARILTDFLEKHKMGIDPITAIFNFLSTPIGQQLITPLVALETDFNKIILDLIKSVHAKLGTANATGVTPSAGSK